MVEEAVETVFSANSIFALVFGKLHVIDRPSSRWRNKLELAFAALAADPTNVNFGRRTNVIRSF